jgi:cobyrinic acid a,c-diamide synthase
MDNTRLSLGYRSVCLKEKSFMGDAGLRVNGHEFHYSKIITGYQNDDGYNQYSYGNHGRAASTGENSAALKNIFECESLASPGVLKKEGYSVLNAIGSYIHLSFFSNKLIAKNIIDNAKMI